MKDFFISYNGKDRQWAEWIAFQLEDEGFTTVIQAWDFRAGGDFVMEMQKAAIGTEKTIAVLSDNYLGAEYTQPEWGNAFARDPQGNKRSLVPVRIAKCNPTGLLATRIYIDLVGLSEEEARVKLMDALKDRGKPDTPPVFPGAKAKTPEPGVPTTHQSKTFPGCASRAVDVWQEKLEFLQIQLAIASAADQKFSIKKQIEEAEQKIVELGGSLRTGSSQPAVSSDASEHATSDNPTLEHLKRARQTSTKLRYSSLLGLLTHRLEQFESLPPRAEPYEYERFEQVIELAEAKFREGAKCREMGTAAKEEIVDCLALTIGGLTLVFKPDLDLQDLISSICDDIVSHRDIRGETAWADRQLEDAYRIAIWSRKMPDDEIVKILNEAIRL